MYNLHHEVPYEGDYIAVNGSLDEIKQWIKDNPMVSCEDLYITMDPDVNIYDLVEEVRNS